MKSLPVFFFFLTWTVSVFAQQSDSLNIQLNEMIANQIESISESSDAVLDYSDLIEEYLFLAENPINLNSDEMNQLRNLNLISEFQLENLHNYIRQYGYLLSAFELEAIEGFDAQTIALIRPLVYAGEIKKKEVVKLSNVARWGRHQVISRFERTLEQQEGYKNIEDSALFIKPNSRYLGSPYKIYTRYTFNYRNRIRAGITMDKDAGEVFFKNSVNDSISRLAGNKLRNGFDFYSAHAYFANVGPLKAVALGDYHIAFGQGITLWSGLSFGKSTDPNGVMKYGAGIKPNTSVNEIFFLRGAAATYGWKNIELTGFYSSKSIDANIQASDTIEQEEAFASSFQETGLHRTLNELLKKGAVTQTVYGARVSFRTKRFEAGITVHETNLDTKLSPDIDTYSKFRFSGNQLQNQGFDFRWVLPDLVFFGELGRSDNGSFAGIAGLTTNLASFVNFTLAYRNYDKSYHNFFSNAFSESTGTNNETGVFAGLTAGLSPRWKLSAYSDFFNFPWLRYQTDAPSYGHDYFAQLDHRISRKADVYFRFRTKQKMTNDDNPWNRIDYIVPYSKNTYRIHINYVISPSFIFKDRAELIVYNQKNKPESQGFIMYHDILYRPESKPFEITLRYAIFDTDDYDSRVYAYENDVLYAFSIPAFSGKGSRVYAMLRLKAHRSLDLWLRVSQTWYSDRKLIGSGLDVIDGNRKTDLKIQLRWKI